ncbi:MAG TPA: ABC transporter permease [Vicinamibacterales bacterium]|nr:ABC transporter permease [Vicinamibacterales bacterium]
MPVLVQPGVATFLYDLRHAARALRHHPGFLAVVVLTLGFGIGINTATFSIVNAVLIRPLAFNEPDRLVALQERLSGSELENSPFSPPDFADVRSEQQSFDGVAAYVQRPAELSGSGAAVRIDVSKVSSNLFDVLGVQPMLGRSFTPEEDRPGVDVAVLSYGLWQTRLGGDRSIVGRAITLDRRPYTVVGVMPPGFDFPLRGGGFNGKPAAAWVPLGFTDRQLQGRGNEFNHGVVARLKAGTSIDAAGAELEVLARRVNERYPQVLRNARFSIAFVAMPLREESSGQMQRPLLLLLGAVGLVLLVACANVANLVLSRAASRSRELALRMALGSSRERLLQLLFAEGALLSIAGGIVGVLLSQVIVAAVPAVVAETLPAAQEIAVDVRVLAFTAAISILTSILFAVIPMLGIDRRGPGSTLQEEAHRTTPGLRRHRMQSGLVVSTVTFAFVLLIGAGLFIRSFSALVAIDGGFDPDRMLTASVTLPREGYPTASAVRAFHESLFRRASSLPGVRSAALVTDLPLERYERRTLAAEGGLVQAGAPTSTNLSWVYGPFVQALGMRLTAGRAFTDVEIVEPRGVVVVNERLVQRLWPGQDAIGKRLRWGLDVPQNPNPWLTIVGVVADVADGTLGSEPFIHAYEPFSQFPDGVLNNIPNAFGRHVKLAVRTIADPRALVAPVRGEIDSIDRQLAIEAIETMENRLGESVAPRRFTVLTLGAFAAGSLLLAAVGLYGLLAFNVAERRHEIAVRLALGAEPPAILRMVVGQGLKLVAIGLMAGAVVSFWMARALTSLLYQTEVHDAITFASVPVVLGLISLAACALPARRASRVEPISALRGE